VSHPARQDPAALPLGLLGGLAAGLYAWAGLLVPLWAVELELPPPAVGLVAGAAAVLPTLCAIPAGALSERLGPRRLLGLAALLAAGAALAGPLARTLEALVALQLVGGLGRSLVWLAAQAYLVRLGGGPRSARRAVVFSFGSMLGTLLSPLAVGLIVHRAGYAPAFLLLTGAYLTLGPVVLALPAAPAVLPALESGSLRTTFAQARQLALRPGMALVLLGTFLRFASGSLRLAFFPVYLDALEFSPLAIGLLVGFGNFVTLGGVLAAGPLLARLGALPLLYLALVLALGALAATPLATTARPLAALAAIWGVGMGLSLPALLQQIAEDTRPGEQGLAVGLRQAVNEAAALLSPLALGLVSLGLGVAGGFYLVGGGLAGLALAGLVWARR